MVGTLRPRLLFQGMEEYLLITCNPLQVLKCMECAQHSEGYTYDLYTAQLPHLYIINDPRIPDLLDDLLEKVVKTGNLYNPAHPRL
jgi:hypothetical protein